MKKLNAVVFGVLIGAAVLGHAKERWCSVSGQGTKVTLVYPPIAKAARVQGVVLAHVIYEPNGRVIRIEPISGPAMLTNSIKRQVIAWTLNTDSKGDEPCMSLLIANFRLSDDLFIPVELNRELPLPSTIRITVEAMQIVISDPAPAITTNHLKIVLKPFQWVTKHLLR
ncbi:MAG TPA: hypothetical protein VG844_02260 [Terracidiphilus sp.]|nr:hypothetical protein [Terracidiphilus sp.]